MNVLCLQRGNKHLTGKSVGSRDAVAGGRELWLSGEGDLPRLCREHRIALLSHTGLPRACRHLPFTQPGPHHPPWVSGLCSKASQAICLRLGEWVSMKQRPPWGLPYDFPGTTPQSSLGMEPLVPPAAAHSLSPGAVSCSQWGGMCSVMSTQHPRKHQRWALAWQGTELGKCLLLLFGLPCTPWEMHPGICKDFTTLQWRGSGVSSLAFFKIKIQALFHTLSAFPTTSDTCN